MQRWREQADNSDDKLTKAILASVLFVGEHLVIEKALLLPQVCRVFLENYGVTLTDGLKSVDLNLEVGDSTVKFSSRWVLNQLIIHLNSYMQYKCIHMKYGTLLYRKEGNLLTSLSWALGAHRSNTSSLEETIEIHECMGKAKILTHADHIFNDLLHEEIKTHASANSDLAHDPSLLNIDNYLKHVNPQLVSFIASATRTTRERRRNTDQDESEANDHVRKVRNYFILSLLLYCTNPKQPPPLHNLLADAVEVCGGSIGSY